MIQNNLFDLSADIICKSTKINDTNIAYLEDAIHTLNSALPPLTSFIIPNSPIHYARTVVRRTERSFWNYHIEHQENSTLPGKYLNRLSDLLFIIARDLHTSETLWKREK
jgi:cob(I)alamin adenosyltransferase